MREPRPADGIQVRHATAADSWVVSDLLSLLGRPPLREDPTAQIDAFLRYVADPDRAVLVAEAAETVVGVASLWIRDRLNWPTPEVWIPDLVVAPSARRRGVGQVLLDACADYARLRSCRALRLECGFDRTDAHPFYEVAGLRRTGFAYRLELEQ